MSNKEIEKKYETEHNEALLRLRKCQSRTNVRSCSECKDFIDCKTRKDYVEKTYKSMSKDSSGGFEF